LPAPLPIAPAAPAPQHDSCGYAPPDRPSCWPRHAWRTLEGALGLLAGIEANSRRSCGWGARRTPARPPGRASGSAVPRPRPSRAFVHPQLDRRAEGDLAVKTSFERRSTRAPSISCPENPEPTAGADHRLEAAAVIRSPRPALTARRAVAPAGRESRNARYARRSGHSPAALRHQSRSWRNGGRGRSRPRDVSRKKRGVGRSRDTGSV
jgi:hypothetical protein